MILSTLKQLGFLSPLTRYVRLHCKESKSQSNDKNNYLQRGGNETKWERSGWKGGTLKSKFIFWPAKFQTRQTVRTVFNRYATCQIKYRPTKTTNLALFHLLFHDPVND